MEFVAMFAVAFILEFINYQYVHAVSHEDDLRTMMVSALGSGLGWILMIVAVRQAELAAAAFVGEVMGNYTAIQVRRHWQVCSKEGGT